MKMGRIGAVILVGACGTLASAGFASSALAASTHAGKPNPYGCQPNSSLPACQTAPSPSVHGGSVTQVSQGGSSVTNQPSVLPGTGGAAPSAPGDAEGLLLLAAMVGLSGVGLRLAVKRVDR